VSPAPDAQLALRLLCADPKAFGGAWLRGDPIRAEALLSELGRPVRRLPLRIDADRLSGGLDVAASLAVGRAVYRDGLLAEAKDDILLVTGAERIEPALAARLAQARDEGGPALILLERGRRGAPARIAARSARLSHRCRLRGRALPRDEDETCAADKSIAALARCAEQFGVGSRALCCSRYGRFAALREVEGERAC
jgi:magnesium chelatase subunit D